MIPFSQILHDHAREIWEENHRHPFLAGLRDGTLPPDRFAYYMKQDYIYLIDYARIFAYGSIKAEDLETMGMFARLLEGTLNTEMELHRQYAARLGISREALEQTRPAPATMAYTRYLLDTAGSGSLAELTAVLLPCMWSYWEIGTAIAQHPGALSHPLYGEWVLMYSSEEFGELARWCIGLMDRLAEGLSEQERQLLQEHFNTASRYEYSFWEMAYQGDPGDSGSPEKRAQEEWQV
ncbi:MAG: transcriptional activator, TenA family [Paenibacillaceae bacterium]|jgi:thiaminase/transcriptional activator TenA|nr:transcriptional activator, TenA family [Paenibacillaceae bacterium]